MAGHAARSLNERIQQDKMDNLERLYGECLRSLMGQVNNTRSSLQEVSQQLPDSKETRDRLQEMQRTFEALEETLQRAGAETAGDSGEPERTADLTRDPEARVTEVLQTGGGLLGETANDAGQLVQRVIDGDGDIMESTLDDTGRVVNEELVARLKDMTPSSEYTDESGNTVHEYTEDVGITIKRVLDASGRVRGLQVVTDPNARDRQG